MNSDLDPSTSSGSSSEVSTPNQHMKCQVCFQRAHGNHFGVTCCRACAAFFRRVFVTHKQHFKCRDGKERCTPDVYGRWNCKRCRTEKCFALGMKPDNIQLNRDRFISSEKFSNQKKLKKTNSIPCSISAPEEKKLITFFDLTPLVEAIERNLMKEPEFGMEEARLNSLEKLAYGLRKVRTSQDWTTKPKLEVIGKMESYNLWKHQMERASAWLMHFDEFRDLEFEDKFTITKCMWLLFARLERCAMTAELRRGNQCGKNVRECVFGTDAIINIDTVEWNFDWLTHFSSEQMKTFLGGGKSLFCENLTDSLMEVQPTDEELCYILCDLCFYYIGKKFGGRMEKISERLQTVLADQMHEYYSEKDKSSRYLHRLSKLLKISQQYRLLMEEKKKCLILGSVFNAFRVKWSHHDIFQYGNFV